MIVKEIRTKSYAKINLSFDITGRFENGYHEIASVMQQISLYDDILIRWFERKGEEFNITIRTNKPYIPIDNRNIVYKIIEALRETTGFNTGGSLEVHIKKRIPVAAGMGGGSGNGASVLIALNKLWGLKLSLNELMEIGGKVGADIPFSVLVQGASVTCALATGFGEKIKPLNRGLDAFVVVAKPNFGVSTKEAFKGIDEMTITKRPDNAALIKAILNGNRKEIFSQMVNVLETYTLTKYPRVAKLKDELKNTYGAEISLMTGSGSTCYGIYNSFNQAKSAGMKLREKGYEAYWIKTGTEKRKI